MSFFIKWCRHRELNTGFILTMDAYYHYTMSACISFYNRNLLFYIYFFNR